MAAGEPKVTKDTGQEKVGFEEVFKKDKAVCQEGQNTPPPTSMGGQQERMSAMIGEGRANWRFLDNW